MSDLFAPLRSCPTWDSVSMRVLPTADMLDGLIVRYVESDELRKVQCSIWYNEVTLYPADYPVMPGEVGHDERRRYVLLGW